MPRRSSSGDASMIWEAAVGSIVEPISASVALARDHVGLVAEYRTVVGVGVEIEVAAVGTELSAGRLQQRVAVGLERVFPRPDAPHDLQARVAAVGVDRDHAPARREAPR